jgi:hypothetical protein
MVLVELDQVVEGVEVAVPGTLDEPQVATPGRVVAGRGHATIVSQRRVPPDGDGKAGRV